MATETCVWTLHLQQPQMRLLCTGSQTETWSIEGGKKDSKQRQRLEIDFLGAHNRSNITMSFKKLMEKEARI